MRHLVWASLLMSFTLNAIDRLPTGARLDAVGRMIPVGNLPLAMVLTPDGKHVVVSLSGYLHQGLQVIDLESGSVIQTLDKNATFLGLAFAGETLYASGGHDNVVYVLRWKDTRLTDERSIAVNYPAGLALSSDGKTLYAAENIADDIAVVDLATSNVVQRLPTDHYPYAVAAGGGRVYVSAWGGNTVSTFRIIADGHLVSSGRLTVGRHPSALLLDGSTLYVTLASTDDIAVVDTNSRFVRRFEDKSPAGLREGSTPNALAKSGDTLYVAEGDNNSVALFSTNSGSLLGRIPTDWYPLGLIAESDRLVILNGKGFTTLPNPRGPQPGKKDDSQYDLSLVNGTIRIVPLPLTDLAAMTARVASANRWTETRSARKYPPFKHVIYIIKENRTYDQLFGDIGAGDGDPSLVFFGREVSPNHHALAARFGLFDRFFVNAEVSTQGHIWSDAAYVTDYSEKTVHTAYAHKRPDVDEGEVDDPAEGYLWDSAIRKGLSLRVYGEFAEADKKVKTRYRATKRSLAADLNPDYPEFDMKISDQHRADIWLAEFDEYRKNGGLPALEIVQLPRDHTGGGKAGYSTPRACMADNDLALARMLEAVSSSPYWSDTVFFVLEDDAQDGADHVDCHRSVLLVLSAYNRAGVIHRFTNTTDVVATIEEILGLDPLSQFDSYGHTLADVFGDTPDLTPYHALKPMVSLDEINPDKGKAAKESASFDLTRPDAVDDERFNDVLWEMLKGSAQPRP